MQTEEIVLWVDKAIELRESSYDPTYASRFGGYKISEAQAIEQTKPEQAKDYDLSIAFWMIGYGNDVTDWKKQIEENNNKKKVLFLSDCNGFEGHDPIAILVETDKSVTIETMKALEKSQLGVGRRGGSWKEIFQDGKIEYKEIKQARKSNFTEKDYDELYNLISGNY